MIKKSLLIFALTGMVSFAWSQNSPTDSTRPVSTDSIRPVSTDSIKPVMDDIFSDSTVNYDELLSDLDLFLDSILAPRSYVLMSLSAGQSYFNFTNRDNTKNRLVKRTIWSPILGFYGKNGLGLTFTSNMIRDSIRREWYQFSVTPSYDYIKNRDLATGISYTRYFTRNGVRFYTSPLQNELNAYFLWRKSWLQPGIMASYGWGSRTEYVRRQYQYTNIVRDAYTTRNATDLETVTVTVIRRNTESIVDFSLATSLRHDFYWLDIFSKKDYIRFSPLLSLSGGTQKFGFNQSSGALPVRLASAINLNNSRDLTLQQNFRILSSTLYLRAEYSFGKFFIQPQFLFDYYFPDSKDHLTTAFSINTGFMF